MVFEGQFDAGAFSRANFGWATPNYAGAFIATVVPVIWGLAVWQDGRLRASQVAASILLAVFTVSELIALYLLCLTFSRGAFIAVMVSGLVFAFLGRFPWKLVGTFVVFRGTIAALFAFKTGLLLRIIPAALAEDGAVLNRLALWRGGIEMCASAPFTGWGPGESGRSFMNWFQDIDRAEAYSTMVNSYLHVAVEYGLWVFALVIAALVALLQSAWRSARMADPEEVGRTNEGDRILAASAGAVVVSWAVANVFTTLWIEPKLWIVPGIACLVILVQRGRRAFTSGLHMRAALRRVGASLLVGTFTSTIVFTAGTWISRTRSERIKPLNGNRVLVSNPTRSHETEVWHSWPDTTVLGDSPGKELRRWFQAQKDPVDLVAYPPAVEIPADSSEPENVLVFGNQATRIRTFKAARELWIVHPTVPPPASGEETRRDAKRVLVLPEIDVIGNGAAWRAWAAASKAEVRVSKGCGVDVRFAWPAIGPIAVVPNAVAEH